MMIGSSALKSLSSIMTFDICHSITLQGQRSKITHIVPQQKHSELKAHTNSTPSLPCDLSPAESLPLMHQSLEAESHGLLRSHDMCGHVTLACGPLAAYDPCLVLNYQRIHHL